MSTVLVNASPRTGASNSGFLQRLFADLLKDKPLMVDAHDAAFSDELRRTLADAERLVFFSPLYVDALPSHFLALLEEIELSGAVPAQCCVYGVINAGLYEGEQTRWAFQVLNNWADKAGLRFGGGVGIGGGEALQALPAADRGPMRPVFQELTVLADRVAASVAEPQASFVSVGMPRILYKWAGEAGWRIQIRKNGGKARDLGKTRRI